MRFKLNYPVSHLSLILHSACDDARIKVWDFPEDGLKESLVEPSFNLIGTKVQYPLNMTSIYYIGHYDRPNILKYHPLAANILATAGYDSNIYIWNVNTQDIAIKLEPLPESVSSSYNIEIIIHLFV